MDIITLNMAKAFARNQISIGIKSISFVDPNIFKFTLVDNSVINVAITDFNNFTDLEKAKLTSLDETVLSKFTISGTGELLFEGNTIGDGVNLTVEQINKINTIVLNGDGSKLLHDNGQYSNLIDGGSF